MNEIDFLYRLFKAHPLVTTDSRNCPQGSIFFALRGDNFDGNQYARQALDKGCAAAVVDNPQVAGCDKRMVVVPDVLTAMQQLAAHHRRQWGGTVLQVTGTNGKTTTKELLAAVLSRRFNVLYTQGNLNNHIGVPRTLLNISAAHNLAIIETGANHPGEIAALSRMVNANYGLVTNVGRAHLEGFGSFAGVKRTKGELYDHLAKTHGRILLNQADADLQEMAKARGLETDSLYYIEARVTACNPFVEIEWRANEDSAWQRVQTHLVGAYNLPNLQAAITAGLHFGVPAHEINSALERYIPTNSRSEWRQTAHNNLLIDAYNANPSSMAAALSNFAQIEGGKKMAILGEMRELGNDSEAEHRRIVERLQAMQLHEVWLVGKAFAALGTAFRHFENVDAVKDALAQEPLTGRTILIKGSNGVGLQQLINCL